MKKNNIKSIVKKRIKISNDNSIKKPQQVKLISTPTIKIENNKLSKSESRLLKRIGNHTIKKIHDVKKDIELKKDNVDEKIKFLDYGKYDRKIIVDYDIIFCVSSYDRYDKIRGILEQIFTQKTKYSFKFILMNDGSTDDRYDDLKYLFPDIKYMKNNIAGGKINYWKTINKIWDESKKFKTYGIIQLDDDFILCDNFLDRLMDNFFTIKEKSNNYMIITFHLYNFDKNKSIESWWFDEDEIFVDGGMLIDTQFLKKINYKLDNIEDRVTNRTSSFTWVRLKERLIEFGMRVYRTKHSLVWHTGNDDSKLHPNVRKLKRVYTKNYIDKIEDYMLN